MHLTELTGEALNGGANVEIAGISCDSRTVEPGYLFAALPGTVHDGAAFIAAAKARGAVAVLGRPGIASEGLPLIADNEPHRRLALLAARFFGRQPETVVAVTGTNGKSSTVGFAAQIWQALGERAASLGTLGVEGVESGLPAGLTTPDAPALHAVLSRLADLDVTRLAMEASSHGLAQHRLDGVRLAAGAFTNLSRDHLDYHGSEDAYLAAKCRLFSELLPTDAAAVLQADGAWFEPVRAAAQARGLKIVSVGHAGHEIRVLRRQAEADRQLLDVELFGQRRNIALPLPGAFQADNALLALALVVACGGDADRAAEALQDLQGIRGRMEVAGRTADGAPVVVDYSHTPDSLRQALRALRPHVRGRLLVVFGAGGDRDPGKRPLMGAAAAEEADLAIVTDDNPRSEDPAAIRHAVLGGAPEALEIGDRRAAIARGIDELAAGDLLLVAGKGHEQGQERAGTVLPFDDVSVVRDCLAGGRT